jgi:hypothetical protein
MVIPLTKISVEILMLSRPPPPARSSKKLVLTCLYVLIVDRIGRAV